MFLVERSPKGFTELLFCCCLVEYEDSIDVDLRFALPGKERQDSVHSGLQVYTFISLVNISNEYFTEPD